jgi:hypothetical protein
VAGEGRQSEIVADDLVAIAERLRDLLRNIGDFSPIRADRFRNLYQARAKLHEVIAKDVEKGPFEKVTGLALHRSTAPPGITNNREGRPLFEVHSVQPAQRIGPDGDSLNQAVISITQKRLVPLDPADALPDAPRFAFRGGCTLIFDLDTLSLRYCIRKAIDSEERLEAQRRYRREGRMAALRATYFGGVVLDEEQEEDEEPFALLHRDEGDPGAAS